MSEHTIDRILDAALEELRSVGIGGFRSRRVATAARISLGTLTHYFPTKERLIESIVHVFLRASSKNWHSQIDAVNEDGLGKIVTGFYDLCCRHRSVVRVIVHLSARDGAVWGAPASSVLAPLLDDVEKKLGPDKRLLAHSVICVSMVYATYSDSELCGLTRQENAEASHEAVKAHLVALSKNSGV